MTVGSVQLRFWIDLALESVRRDHSPVDSDGDQRGPFLTARAMAMALAALHDANAIASGREPLLSVPEIPNLLGSDPILAAASACHQLLRNRYPKQVKLLDPAWDLWLERYYPDGIVSSAIVAGRASGDRGGKGAARGNLI